MDEGRRKGGAIMTPTREEIREIIADMPNWETLEHLFAYVIGHWEHIKRRKAQKRSSVYREMEELMQKNMRKRDKEFFEKCVLPCVVIEPKED